MNKKRLVEFINKYNVAKNEQVVINSVDNVLTVESKPADTGGLRISVSLKNAGIPDCGFGILETKKFKSMLSILDDEVTVKINQQELDDVVTSLEFKDKTNKKVSVVTADLSVLEQIDPVKSLPTEYPLILPITSDLIKDFNTAVGALSVKLFSVNNFEDVIDAELMFGYRLSANVDTIKIPLNNILADSKFLPDCEGTFTDTVYFDAEHFLEIINVNKDISAYGKIMFSEDLIRIEYDSVDFKSQYLLVAAEV